MTLITGEELARGLLIGGLGGAAGLCTVALPGSLLWLLPAGLAVGGCALTVPELRTEVGRLRPAPTAWPTRWPGLPWTAGAAPAPAAPSPRPDRAARPDPLLETLTSTPHRLIIGHTRGGKTTLIHHLATQWAAAGERVLVGDPDAAPGLWPGCEVRGAGDAVASIGELVTIVATVVGERRAQRATGVRQFPPLHLVIDEAQDVLPALPGALDLFEDVARRGGKLNIHMTIGVQDKQVRTLGLAGKSDLLRNFQVADVLKQPDGTRVAVLRDAATGARVTLPIPPLRDPETLIRRAAPAVSQTSVQATPEPSDLLAQLLAQPVSTAIGRADTPASVSVSVSRTVDPDTDTPPVSRTTVRDTGAAVVVNVTTHALPGRARQRRGRGLDMRQRRQRHQAGQVAAHKRALQQAYAQRKQAGGSFRKAYAELGGASHEARAWWRAAPAGA